MRVADLVETVETIAPLSLAEPWDNVGLLLGDREAPLEGPTLLTIDLTPDVADEAISLGAGAIIAYHPPIFEPLKRITTDTVRGGALLRLLRAGVAVYSPHTAIDAAEGGATDWLADGVSASGDRRALAPANAPDSGQTHKFVTFVPRESVEKVRNALSSAGAGRIGEYDLCSFELEGTGTFQGSSQSNPTIGQPGRLERVREVRLEMACSGKALPLLVETLRTFHPYEEPAFDIYPLAGRPDRSVGAGRRLVLDRPMTPEQIAANMRDYLGLPAVRLAAVSDEPVTHVGVCPGAGGSLLEPAVAEGCTLFITGEMRHHALLSALDMGCSVILAGHTNTERGYLPKFAMRIHEISPDLRPTVSKADRMPWRPV